MKKLGKVMIKLMVMIGIISFSSIPFGHAAGELIHPEVGFLVVAPDRGFLGNEEVRELYEAFSENYAAELSFATAKQTRENLASGMNRLKARNVRRVWVLPLFLSPAHTLYQKAVKVLEEESWGVPIQISDTMHTSYLTDEILKKRIKSLSKKPSQEVLVVVSSGAADQKSEDEIKADIESVIGRVNKAFRFRASEAVVLYDRSAEKEDREDALDRAIERIALNRAKGERVLVVPFNFGRKLTNMMAEWNWVKRRLSKYDKIVSDGEGILPHENVGIWLKKMANLRLPLSDEEIGVVLMPHGSDFNWNETIRQNLKPLLERYKIEYAFSMADPKVIERAVERLEKRGARAIMVIRVFSLAASFREKTEYILGLNDAYRRAGGTMRVSSPAIFTTLGGTEDDSLLADIMLERAKGLSKNPEKETVILLAHGTDDEERNRHWMNNLATLAGEMQKNGGSAFKDIQYYTWREDWPDKRDKAVEVIRQMIEIANRDGGTAILVPERITGQGHGEEFLEGLDFRYTTGFAPHPNFVKWVEGQIERGKNVLLSKPLVADRGDWQPMAQAHLQNGE
ncbi:MAG: sirohydrochlorin chelatase [Nitrospiria bacterium]